MSDENRLYHKRVFLNLDAGAAMVEARVNDHCSVNKHNGERSISVDGNLHITDCSRSVELDCSFYNLDDARQVLEKLDRLIDAAQGMREALARAARREWPGRKL